jgi:uncharacterized membrane protein YraQ (UPF0718 family)
MFNSLISLYRANREQSHLLFLFVGLFLAIYFVPIGTERVDNALLEGFRLTNWYAREHVILCLVPAFIIAGAMSVYINEGAVLRYLGPDASKPVALGIASVSGAMLAVCSCTVLPLFGGIYRRGAGLGAATAFLYSGPAINVMAIVVTAKVLGVELGIARAIGAIGFAIVIGALMHMIYRKDESTRAETAAGGFPEGEADAKPGVVAMFFALMVGILVFANWPEAEGGVPLQIYEAKWWVTSMLAGLMGALLVHKWQWRVAPLFVLAILVAATAYLVPNVPEVAFATGALGLILIAATRDKDEAWAGETWLFAKQIMPLLLAGVFIAGLLLGRPGHEGLIPSEWVSAAVGDNSLVSTAIASVLGAFMYFSTLTEVPIVEGLLGAGMGKGPALALLLAGPALSLPNMLVIRSILGTRKTLTYCFLVIVMATATGYGYGNFF